MSKYVYIVSANTKYLRELNILLNSLEYENNIQDVHVVSWALPKEYLDKLSQLSYEVIVHEVADDPKMQELGEAETLMRFRYELASQLTNYNAVCVLDADTCIIRNLDIWFEIAAKSDVIIGCGLEQKRWYGEPENNHKVNGEHFLERVWNAKDICCSPIFFNPKKFGDAFHFSWSIVADYDFEHRFKGPDMDAINMAIIKFGYQDRVITLAETCWNGLHETLLKPLSHVCKLNDGKFWTISGEEIFILHGQWLNPIWQDCSWKRNIDW